LPKKGTAPHSLLEVTMPGGLTMETAAKQRNRPWLPNYSLRATGINSSRTRRRLRTALRSLRSPDLQPQPMKLGL
jgi:hypothetical protein